MVGTPIIPTVKVSNAKRKVNSQVDKLMGKSLTIDMKIKSVCSAHNHFSLYSKPEIRELTLGRDTFGIPITRLLDARIKCVLAFTGAANDIPDQHSLRPQSK